jgi:ABC-2 type transport system permease protein
VNAVAAIMYREFRIRTTSLTWLFFDLIVPLSYLLLFGIALDRTFAGGFTSQDTTLSYNAFFLAGVLSMACFGIAINTSYGFFVDRDNGIFYEFLTYPMTRAQFLFGKILFNTLLSLLQAALTIGAGALVLGIHVRWDLIPLALAGVAAGTAGWVFFLSAFALRIRRNDMFNTFINVAYFVMMFASTMFYPMEALPEALRYVAWANPLTWHTDALRYCTIGVGVPELVLLEAVAFGVFLLASFAFAVWTLTKGILA